MFRGHGNEISPATPAGFGPLEGGPVILLTLFEARVEHDAPSTRAWSMVGQRVALYWLSACSRLRWPEIVGRRPTPWASTTVAGLEGGRYPLPHAARLLLREHDCFAEGGDRFPLRLAPQHGRDQCRAREVSAYRRREDTAVFCPSGAVLHRVLHRVLWAILAVVTPRRFFLSPQTQVPPETPVSGEDLCQAEGQDAVTPI